MTGVRLKPGVSPGSSGGSSGSPPQHQDRPHAALQQPFDYTAADVRAAGRLQPDAKPRQPLNSDAASAAAAAGPGMRQQSHNQGGAPAAELQQPYSNPAAAASSEVAPRQPSNYPAAGAALTGRPLWEPPQTPTPRHGAEAPPNPFAVGPDAREPWSPGPSPLRYPRTGFPAAGHVWCL